MTEDKRSRRPKILEAGVQELRLENGDKDTERGRLRTGLIKEEFTSSNKSSPRDIPLNSASHSPVKTDIQVKSPYVGSEKHEEVVGGDVTLKFEPGQPPKLARSTSHKIISKPAAMFHDYPSKTEESKSTFQVLKECSYSSKYIGSTEHGSMDCDCAEEWGKAIPHNSLLLQQTK